MAELKLFEVIWADSMEKKKSLNFYCGNVLFAEVAFKAAQWEKKLFSQIQGESILFKVTIKIRVVIYRISLCLN